MSEVVVIRTGTANLASVLAALGRAGVDARVSDDPRDAEHARRLVLPGVGSFGAGMHALNAHGLVEPLRRRIIEGRPTLAVCLGLQLLAESSEESPGVRGLGVIPASVTRFPDSVRVPQIGWNRVFAGPGCALLESGCAYYANSYRLEAPPSGWACATSDHAGPFVGAMERGRALACQFHPELSGPWGRALVERWLCAGTGARRPCALHGAIGRTPFPRVIPCLDVHDGRIVKGVRFADLRDAGDPAERAALYEAQGADEIVILDVSATPEGRKTASETVRRVRAALSIPLTVGGGVRTPEDAAALLDAGADKVSVNTAAVERPALVADLAGRFGAQCTVLAIDAARRRNAEGAEREPGSESDLPSGGSAPRSLRSTSSSSVFSWEVVTRSGTRRTGVDAVDWARRACELGAGEVLLTSFDRDGTREGYDLDLLRSVSVAVPVPVIASGGADTPEHLKHALEAGADAVLAASIFHDGEHTVDGVKQALAALGVALRPAG